MLHVDPKGNIDPLLCDVVKISPPIHLPWRYTHEQEKKGDVWEFGSVWLHNARPVEIGRQQAEYNMQDKMVRVDLERALAILKDNVDAARYTLLVNPDGMEYNPDRFGGDHQIFVPESGRRFTLSVRRVDCTKVLLAINWGIF
jgi:hypothetical protein